MTRSTVLFAFSLLLSASAVRADLPAGYTAVDYLVAPKGSYVDTGYKPNQNSCVMMDVTVQGLNEYWFGCWDEAYNKGAFALGNDDRLGVYYAVGNDGGSVRFNQGVDGLVSKGRHAVGITPYSFLVDGAEWMTKERGNDFLLLNNLYLFAQNRKGTAVPGEYQHDIICHGCMISEGGTTKRNFVPCVRMADAVAGLYDTVEGKFYGNLGSGAFGASDERLPLGRELSSGTYAITESFAFAAPLGESALKIADGATVTLDIPEGVTVSLRGGGAVGTTGGGAGIEVPANATLKVTGAGRLVAYGGRAANGADGHAGQNGSASQVQGRFESGGGGWGGNGGGGAGAGIGGRGGVGGEGGASGPQVVGRDWSYTDIAGNPGEIGGNGGNGGTCGSVSVEDLVTVIAHGGAAGAADGAGGASGQWAWLEGGTYYFGGFGGGGGGSGARGGAAQDIGGGGGGGFGGGGGGSGGYLSRFKWNTFKAQPAWGIGGIGAANGAAGGATSGFLPGFHGVSGACGGGGTLLIASDAVACAKEGRYSVGRISETAEVFYDNGKLLSVSNGISSELSYSVVSNNTGTLGNGWYVVNGTVSRKNRILVSGAANLVLLHCSSLTLDCRDIRGVKDRVSGIEVCDNNSLRVFGTETGTLTAMGSERAAGIGSAWRFVGDEHYCGSCGSITFYGGMVKSTGGELAAGIGGGYKGAGGTVTINGGTVTAEGGFHAPGIGGGDEGAGATVAINGGTVASFGGRTSSRSIVGYSDGAGGSLTLGRRVYEIDGNHWREGLGVTFVVPADVRVSSAGVDRAWMEESRYFAVNPDSGRTMTFTFEVTDPACRLVGDASLTVGPVFRNRELFSPLVPYAEEVVMESVDYVLPSGEVRSANNVFPIRSRADVSVLSQSWYQVTGSLSRSVLTVVGEVNLILCDGASLTVNGGVRVGEGNALNIFCQEGGTGRLVAVGSGSCAGIGGGFNGAGGTVTINGGTVTATGGIRGAGIGGGQGGAGGTVTINGGTVTATGGNSEASFGGGAGIGGGQRGAGGTVTINGGMVTATGGEPDAVGIGGGDKGEHGAVVIAGGTVVADGSAGLGGTATIDGGSIMAKSIPEQPKNTAGVRLYKVTVRCPGIVDQGSEVRLEGLDGYGTRDIYPIDGFICLYLPDGGYRMRVTSGAITRSVSFSVMSDDVNVDFGGTGEFFVNGEDFITGAGEGWACLNNRLVLSSSMCYVLTGTEAGYGIEITGDATVVLSNATITTSGRPALSVADGKNVNLQMSGLTSYLFATNASAIALGNAAKLTVGSVRAADRLAEIVAVSYGDDVTAISGATASTEVESGNFLVKSDSRAAEGTFGISETPTCPLLMKAGSAPDKVLFADAYNGEAFVGVVRSYAITVPTFEGVASVAVSNDVEELKGVSGVYRAMLTEEVTIDFVAAEGYEIVDNAHIYIPSLTNDVTVGDAGCAGPDIRRKLTVAVPETDGISTVVVTEGGEEVMMGSKGEGLMVYPVRSGYDVEIVCTAQEDWRIVAETNVIIFANIQDGKVLSAADMPEAWRLFTVSVPEMENACYILTSSDGLRTVTPEGAELVLSNAEVTVTFYGVGNYRITANGAKTWTLTADVAFGTTEGFPLPTVEGIPGTIVAPWSVGENVQAYTNDEGVLTITGTGAMSNFANAADVPWDPDTVTHVAVEDGVVQLGANSFAALDDAVTVNGTTMSMSRFIAPALGAASSQPSGAISGAEFEQVQIIDGKAYLDVSVYTNSEVKAKGEGEGWGVATNGVIEVPAPGKQGFFYLMSKPSAPTDAPHAPIFIPEIIEE